MKPLPAAMERCITVLALLLALVPSVSLDSQTWADPPSDAMPKIEAPPTVRLSGFGAGVSIKGDHALIGAVFEIVGKRNSGAAYVYHFDGGVWAQQALLTAPEACHDARFGTSVGMGDNLLVIGAPGDNSASEGSGAAYVFRQKESDWIQEAKLVADDAEPGDAFGWAVAISGNDIIVGARLDDVAGMQSGSAYVFEFVNGQWAQRTKLTASDAAAGDEFGTSVALSGNTAIIGAQAQLARIFHH